MGNRVLVVDDAMFMRKSLTQVLKNSGYEVVGEATNGEEAIKAYKMYSPDVVLMDITMDKMDGLTALTRIREFDQEANVIIVSAMGHERQVKKALRLGAKHFVVKPFSKKKLLDTLKKVLFTIPL